MATLIYASNSSGCIGKCDANCYDAKQPECDCICGGKNHGAGKKQAIENTQKYVNEWIKQYKDKHINEPALTCIVNADEVYQFKIF